MVALHPVIVIIALNAVRLDDHTLGNKLFPQLRNINVLYRCTFLQRLNDSHPGGMPRLHPGGLQAVGTKSNMVERGANQSLDALHHAVIFDFSGYSGRIAPPTSKTLFLAYWLFPGIGLPGFRSPRGLFPSQKVAASPLH